MERAIEIFAAVNFLVIGLSHMIQPRAWNELFVLLRDRGMPGVLVNGMLSLSFGSIIVAFHNVWSGLPMVLTIVGWLNVAKSLVNLVAPSVGMRSLQRVEVSRTHEMVIAGGVFLLLSAFSWYLAFRP
jgi:uncharacterized membrane protein